MNELNEDRSRSKAEKCEFFADDAKLNSRFFKGVFYFKNFVVNERIGTAI